jgi:hypothetical protein
MGYTGFEALKEMSQKAGLKTYSIQSLFPVIRPFEYSGSRVLLGWDRAGKPVWMDIRTSKIVLIVGKRGCGKTFIMRALADRLYMSNHIPVILTDIKGEYRSSRNPVQDKFRQLLSDGEKPTGFDVKSYFPVFLQKYSPSAQRDDDLCQLSLSMINIYDLMTLLGFDDDTSSTKKELLMRAFRKLEERNAFTYLDLEHEIWDDIEGNTSTKESVVASLKTAYQEGILGDQFSDFSFVEDILNGKRPVLNLSGYYKMGQNIGYPSAFVSVLAREVIESKKRGEIEQGIKIFYFIDEAHRWVPAVGNSAAKRTLLNIAREERSSGVSLICATQSIGSVDETIRKQASVILFPWNIDAPTVIGIMKDIGLYERYGRFSDNLNRNLQGLRSREWVMVDADKRDLKIISRIASPLSMHEEEI